MTKRKKTGPAPLPPDKKTTPCSVCLTPDERDIALRLGDGAVSTGVRRALRMAADQKTPKGL